MSDTLTPMLTRTWDSDRSWTLAAYRDKDGYRGLHAALQM